MHILELINKFTYDCRERFNTKLLERSDEELIDEIIKIIVRCQSYRLFTIHMINYTVLDDPIEIHKKLFQYRQNQIDKKKGKKKEDNQYNYIPFKDSAIKLLIVRYYIAVNNDWEEVEVYIVIPRVVNKYYYKIMGNHYVPMWQIVDSSTYNNSGTKSKKHNVTQKTIFMPIRIYRNIINLTLYNKNKIDSILYSSLIFNNNVNPMKYILAKYGYYDGVAFIGVQGLSILDHDPENEDYYVFEKNGIFLSIHKYLFDNDTITQSLIVTIIKAINKNTTYNNITTNEFWLASLGQDFGGFSVQNGLSVLDSIESLYDFNVIENLNLPISEKQTSYHLLRWLMRDFSGLKVKNNLDLSTKRVRISEYISTMYAIKLSKGIHRISGYGRKIELSDIRKVVLIDPWYLMNQISKNGTLISYRSNVNDNDAVLALKYTYKGLSGMGEKSNSTISDIIRSTDPSELGFLDQDSSSNSDPGLSGTLCPYAQLTNNKFYDKEEPLEWESNYREILNGYKEMISAKEVFTFKKHLGMDVDYDQLDMINACIDISTRLVEPIVFLNKAINEPFFFVDKK